MLKNIPTVYANFLNYPQTIKISQLGASLQLHGSFHPWSDFSYKCFFSFHHKCFFIYFFHQARGSVCHTCRRHQQRLHSCLHCVFFGCYNLGHIHDHFRLNKHFLGILLLLLLFFFSVVKHIDFSQEDGQGVQNHPQSNDYLRHNCSVHCKWQVHSLE